jgi:hypothetical protein
MTKSTTRTSIICLWVWMIPCVFFLAGSTHHSSPLTGVAAWSSDNSMSTSSIRRRPGTFSRPQQQQQQQHAPTTTTTTTALFTLNDSGEQNTRRNFLLQSSSLLLSVPSAVLLSPAVAAATDQDNASATNTTPTPAKSSSPVYQRQNVNSKISYSISVPSTFQETQKPVKTHLDEINFVSDDVKGYQFGITVDPVRINSLKEVSTGLWWWWWWWFFGVADDPLEFILTNHPTFFCVCFLMYYSMCSLELPKRWPPASSRPKSIAMGYLK